MGSSLFDRFFILHLAFGIIAYFFDVKLQYWILIHSLYEFLENTQPGIDIITKYFSRWPGGKRNRDCTINIIGDTVSAISGWIIGYFVSEVI